MDRPVHRELLEALLARDPERTRAAVEAHYRYAEERLFDDLQ
jgi:DNA-binding GntR family transcriptional regulator